MSLIIFCLPSLFLVVWVEYAVNPILAGLLFSLTILPVDGNLATDGYSDSHRMRTRSGALDTPGTSQGGDNTPNPPNPPLAPTLADVVWALMNASAKNARIFQALAQNMAPGQRGHANPGANSTYGDFLDLLSLAELKNL